MSNETDIDALARNDSHVQSVHAAYASGTLTTVEPDDLP